MMTNNQATAVRGHTYGEFIAALENAEENCVDIRSFLEQVKGAPAAWQRLCSQALTRKLVLEFSRKVVEYFREVSRGIYDQKISRDFIEEGHDLMRKVAATAVLLGVAIDIEEIDVPLTPTGVIMSAG